MIYEGLAMLAGSGLEALQGIVLKVLKGSVFIFLSSFIVSNTMAQFEGNPLSQAVDNTSFDIINLSPGWEVTNGSSTIGGDSAISSIIADGSVATMSIEYLDTMGRGGSISFDWQLTDISRAITSGDELIFIIADSNGNQLRRETLRSENGWESVSIDIPARDVLLIWAYAEDGAFESSVIGNENGRGWVDNIRITRNGASLPPACRTFNTNLNSALDNNDFSIASSSFTCQTDDYTFGGSAAQSPTDRLRGTTSDLDITVLGPVDLIFDWRIDAGAEDLFELQLDFEEIDSLSGTTEWATRRISVPEGQHIVRWRYRVFSSTPINSNSGLVDHLRTAPFTNIRENLSEIPIAPVIDLLLEP